MAGLLETLPVDRERMRAAADEGYTTATAVADALVRRGMPFRVAHHVVGSLVAQAEEAGLRLDEVPDSMIGLALGGARRRRPRRAGRGRARDRRRRSAAPRRSRVRSRRATSSAARRPPGWRRRSPLAVAWASPARASG